MWEAAGNRQAKSVLAEGARGMGSNVMKGAGGLSGDSFSTGKDHA